MRVVDLDPTDLHVSILDFNTSLPYIDPQSGLVSDDMPLDDCVIELAMYEPNKTDLNIATVTFQSHVGRPYLKSLLQAIKAGPNGGFEGARVEIRNYQPFGGAPIFAGTVPVEGVTEKGGNVVIEVHDSRGNGKQSRVRRFEEFNSPVSDLYTRGLKGWKDVAHANMFLGSQPPGYSRIMSGTTGTINWSAAGLTVYAPSDTPWNYSGTSNIDLHLQADGGDGSKAFALANGDVFLIEADVTLAGDMHMPGASNTAYHMGGLLGITNIAGGAGVGMNFDFWAQNGALGAVQQNSLSAFVLPSSTNSPISNTPNFSEGGIKHRYSCLVRIDPAGGKASVYAARDGYVQAVLTGVSFTQGGSWAPFFNARNNYGSPNGLIVSSFRARKLVPYLNKAARFNPQTSSPIYYLANNEDSLSFLYLMMNLDGAEARLNYKSAPALDEIELDAVGTLGTVAPQQSYLFDEDLNMVDMPEKQARATPHANDIVFVGASSTNSQAEAEAYSPAETGDPLVGILPTYPIYEKLINNDKVGLTSLGQTLANLELARSLDSTPSLLLRVAERIDQSMVYREGDSVFTKTRSLLNNVEQNMRIAKIKIQRGSPIREITVGRLEDNPDNLRQAHIAMVESWLYEQTGAGYGTVYGYPFSPWVFPSNISTIQASATYSIPFNQVNTNTQIVSATVRWFMNNSSVGANSIYCVINGAVMTTSSGTADSGDIPCTSVFTQPGQLYSMHFEASSTGSSLCQMDSAFLILRVKV